MIDVRDDQQRHGSVVHQLTGVATEPEGGHIVLFLTHDDHQVHILLLAPLDDGLGNLSVNVDGGGGVTDTSFATHADGMVKLDVDDVFRLRNTGSTDTEEQ